VRERRYQQRLKRDERRTEALIEDVIGSEPDPQFAAQVAEEFQALLDRLEDDTLRSVACYKLEGYTNGEIAARLQYTDRTVERKLALIRRVWEETEEP
jgi:DNA-directed RNA polymerase specialized sigma24 family protein